MEGKGEMRQGKERVETIVGVKAEDWRSRDVCTRARVPTEKQMERASLTEAAAEIASFIADAV